MVMPLIYFFKNLRWGGPPCPPPEAARDGRPTGIFGFYRDEDCTSFSNVFPGHCTIPYATWVLRQKNLSPDGLVSKSGLYNYFSV